MRNTYDQADIKCFLGHIVDGIVREFRPDEPLNIVGIRTRGDIIAARLAKTLADRGFSKINCGDLDITLYRDDLAGIGARRVMPTNLNFSLEGLPCILVDDVLFTGRSVRAALNLLHDFGRPGVIRLAVLVDRNGRELPIGPDYYGLRLRDVPPNNRVNVRLTETDNVDEIVVEPRL